MTKSVRKSQELTTNVVRKSGDEWCIFSKDGKKLECKPTEAEAKKRLGQIEYFKGQGNTMTIRVNVRCKVNNAAIRHEKRDGRDHIVVPAATLPDNVVMNGGLYPADEIEKGYKSLEGTPAPMGHPQVNGQFVSASMPEAINRAWVGAWNENVRRENGRVKMDKVVDVEVANRTEDGRALLAAINEKKPIHTSTGLNLDREMVGNVADYEWIARNMEFDHDCFLLNQPGAATPDQGVGVFVNSSGEKMDVINSDLTEAVEMDMEHAARFLVESVQRLDKAQENEGLVNRIIEAVRGLVSGKTEDGAMSVNHNQEENTMTVTDEQFKALSDKVETLASNQKKLDGLNEKIDKLVTNQEAADKARRAELETKVVNAGLLDEETVKGVNTESLTKLAATAEKMPVVNKIVKAGLLDEETAKTMDLAALNKLAEKAEPGQAHNMAGHFTTNDSDDWSKMEMPGGKQ